MNFHIFTCIMVVSISVDSKKKKVFLIKAVFKSIVGVLYLLKSDFKYVINSYLL